MYSVVITTLIACLRWEYWHTIRNYCDARARGRRQPQIIRGIFLSIHYCTNIELAFSSWQ